MKIFIKISGSKNDVVCAREGGANTTPLFPAAHFAKQNTKFGGCESEGGAGIHFLHTSFSSRPARAHRIVCAARSAAFYRFLEILAKMGSCIFKQRAPNWTSRFFVGGSKGMLAAPAGAARKELGGKIKRRDKIPRNNFFGNEAVRHNEVMYKNKFLFQFFAQNIPQSGIEAIFHSLAEHKPRQNIKL